MSELSDAVNRLIDLPEVQREPSGAKVDCECAECESLRSCRNRAIEDCVKAARDGFDLAMEDYVLIGPSGMAMMIINSVRNVQR